MRQADCILVLKGGQIAERGQHEELMQRNGIYVQLQIGQTGKTEATK